MTSAEGVFKSGFAKVLSPAALASLREACRADDPRLTTGRTVFPWDTVDNAALLAECGCPVAFCGMAGGATVGDAAAFFAKACFDADQELGEVAGCRFFLNWVDDTPRPEMLSTLAGWIDDVLAATVVGAK
jgi:hypothetical protein